MARPPTAALPVSETVPPTTEAGRWRDFLLHAAIIVLAGLWIYSPAYHGDWLWDDDQLLTANPVVQSGSLQGLGKLWFNPDGADFFPLSYTALWAQWPFFKNTPTGYHVTTIVLHVIGSLLLWALLHRMRVPGAWLSGLIFAIHPVAVESVAWVSETKNTLSLPLFLLSCLCWVVQDEEREGPRRTWFYVLSIVFFLLAMLAKTSMVGLPVLLLLHAWWKRGTVTLQDVIRAAPFFLISIVLGIITIQYQHGRAIGAEKILVGGVASRIATAGMAILFYLAEIVWPVNLLPIYPRWEVDPPKAWQFLAWPVIAAAAAWIWANRGTADRPGWGRNVLFGLGFFLLMVLPVLGFVTISYMRITWVADHFNYLPMIGVIALIGAAATRWYERSTASAQPLIIAGGGCRARRLRVALVPLCECVGQRGRPLDAHTQDQPRRLAGAQPSWRQEVFPRRHRGRLLPLHPVHQAPARPWRNAQQPRLVPLRQGPSRRGDQGVCRGLPAHAPRAGDAGESRQCAVPGRPLRRSQRCLPVSA